MIVSEQQWFEIFRILENYSDLQLSDEEESVSYNRIVEISFRQLEQQEFFVLDESDNEVKANYDELLPPLNSTLVYVENVVGSFFFFFFNR